MIKKYITRKECKVSSFGGSRGRTCDEYSCTNNLYRECAQEKPTTEEGSYR